ncbi:MAG: molybdenum ABC transporter ATP-binding protein [Alphaproteobacteria bacterium]
MIDLTVDARNAYPDFELDISHRFGLDGITALFGPSGCGKTTLLRIIAGLEKNAEGRIAFGDEAWLDTGDAIFVPPHRRGVGYVFQDARLFPHLSVAGNLRYAARRSAGIDRRIEFDDVVTALDLGALLPRRVGALSGGERQRAAIGRTLLTRPRLLLMDEPLAALDIQRKAEILPYIERLPGAFGVPVIYVTHAIDEVAGLARRMVVLANGKKVAEGPVAAVLERLDLQPATGRFEAGVVLTARIVGHDNRFHLTRLDHHGQAIDIPMVELPIGSAVRLRVRARDVSLATERPGKVSVRNILSGTISQIEEEADTAFAETLVDVGGANLRARITRAAVADLCLSPGTPVFALVKSIAFDRRALVSAGETSHPEPAETGRV